MYNNSFSTTHHIIPLDNYLWMVEEEGNNLYSLSNKIYISEKLTKAGYIKCNFPSYFNVNILKYDCGMMFVKSIDSGRYIRKVVCLIEKNKISQVHVYENAYSEIKNRWVLLKDDWFYVTVSGTWNRNYLRYIYETSDIYIYLSSKLGYEAALFLQKNNFALDYADNLSRCFLCHSHNRPLYGKIIINLKSPLGTLINCYFAREFNDIFSAVYSEENLIIDTPEELIDSISFFLKYDVSKIITPSIYFKKAVTNMKYWAVNDLQKGWV